MKTTIHCSSCGQTNPVFDSDGYTECCGKTACWGTDYPETWVAENGQTVKACCFAKADEAFIKTYGQVPNAYKGVGRQ